MLTRLFWRCKVLRKSMYFHEIKRTHKNETKKRVGRGGKRGTYSGRGLKGQKQHASHAPRPEVRDMIKKIPKKRGYRVSSIKNDAYAVNVGALNKVVETGGTITPQMLREKGVIHFKKGEKPIIKILGGGEITKKINVKNCLVSKTAQEKIEKAGGTIVKDSSEKEPATHKKDSTQK